MQGAFRFSGTQQRIRLLLRLLDVQGSLDAGAQLRRIDGFGQIVIGAGCQHAADRFRSDNACEHQDLQIGPRRMFAEVLQYFQTANVRKVRRQQNQIVLAGQGHFHTAKVSAASITVVMNIVPVTAMP